MNSTNNTAMAKTTTCQYCNTADAVYPSYSPFICASPKCLRAYDRQEAEAEARMARRQSGCGGDYYNVGKYGHYR